MNQITPEEIDDGLALFEGEYKGEHNEELELIGEIQTQDHVSVDQLERIIRWKLINQGGRADRYIGMMREIPDEAIEYITRSAYITEDPETQLKILNGIPGVGFATATVILTFHNPEEYAVGDRLINGVILGDETYVTPKNYSRLLAELEQFRPDGYTLRQTEKALFIQEYVD